ANPFLAHLQSLRELQITLSQEGRAEAILSDGTTGTVEIVGADCAVAVVEPSNGLPPLRFGWIEGRHMAPHEVGMVLRRLDDPVPFNREQILLADILATLMAIQIERALRASDARRASERIQEECDTATRHLNETTLELQAINAVAAAATPSLDLDRQIEISLRKTLEVTRFKVGA